MKISDTRFVVVDTETTGLDPTSDSVVEIGLVEVSRAGIKPIYDTLVNPGRDIPPTASAVHHLTQKDVVNKPELHEIWPTLQGFFENAVLVAHNAQFDKAMIPETNRPWLCTLRLAKHLWPDAPAHNNQVLRYWLGLNIATQLPHRAAADALVTAHIFWELLRTYRALYSNNLDDFLKFTDSPIEIKTMPFGKYRGSMIREIPTDYLKWLISNISGLDYDLKYTLEKHLNS